MSVGPLSSILDKVTSCSLLHRGGEADVYALVADGKKFVLKWYRGGGRYDDALIQKLERFSVPGLYRVRESGTRENVPYLVYDFVPGCNTAEISRMPVPVALSMLRCVAKTLAALAQEEIHHGDLNPANVVLCPVEQEAALQPVLIDCGIVGPGALAYAAPERIQGKSAGVRSDLYSLGMLLFRWVAGRDLIEAEGFDGFVAGGAAIDSVDVDQLLYEANCCSASELSALNPIWKSLLRFDPECRAEDFDELDELLEIALDSMGVGEVSCCTALKSFAETLFDKKTGQKVPSGTEKAEMAPLPYRKNALKNQKKWTKSIILGILGLILVVIALLVAVGTNSPDIDATGDLLLKKSRSLESAVESPDSGLAPPDSLPSVLLEDLPTPASDDRP